MNFPHLFYHITHLSFSSLWLYMTDREKWGRQYVDKIKDEPSEAMLLGSRVHKDIELYLLGQGDKDADKLYFPCWLEWFDSKTGLILTPEVKGTHNGIVGCMDAVSQDKARIYDWKVCKSRTKDFNLRYELQAATYSLLVPEAQTVTFVEIIKKKKPTIHEYPVLLSALHTKTILQLFNNMKRELQGEYLAPEWKDLYYIESVFRDALDLNFLLEC